jgi:hypothetical protein
MLDSLFVASARTVSELSALVNRELDLR